jgi:7-cyano-7-deazaguanine synthase
VPDKSSIGILVSGGLDSAVLLAESTEVYRHVWPIYVRQGLVWEEVELYWLRRFIRQVGALEFRPLKVLSCPMGDVYGDHWSTGRQSVPGARSKDQAVYLPGRNLVLSLKPAVFAAMNKIPVLALGSLTHNPFSDAAPAFFRQWGAALSRGLGASVRVIAPYRQQSKVDVIRRGEAWPLHLSFSCIAPVGRHHCGRCNKCAERRRAFRMARVEDKTIYASN